MKFKLLLLLVLVFTGCGKTEFIADFDGYKVNRNNPDIVTIKKDAENGNAKAQFVYGGLYMVGNGVPQDKTEGIKWIRKSAENNYAYAQATLGACYADGNGVTQDKTEGIKWFRKALDNGYSEAQQHIEEIKTEIESEK